MGNGAALAQRDKLETKVDLETREDRESKAHKEEKDRRGAKDLMDVTVLRDHKDQPEMK